MKNIIVLFGGKSCEREISVLTGVFVLNAINKKEYNAIPLYIDKNGDFYYGEELKYLETFKSENFTKNLKKAVFLPNDNTLYINRKNKLKPIAKIACGVNCCHGGFGEDGSLYAYFDISGIPLTSSSLLASSIAMDKCATKDFLRGNGVKTVNSVTVYATTGLENAVFNCVKSLTFPLIVKPAFLGSSVGIEIAENEQTLFSAIASAFKYGEKVIVEEFLQNSTEINCASVLTGGTVYVSECEKPITANKILSFTDKYETGQREFPAKISKNLSDKIKATTEKVYRLLNARGIIRIDYLIKNDKVYLNEINSVPGSLSYYLLSNTVEDFTALLTSIIQDTIKEQSRKSTIISSYESGILNTAYKGTKGSKK